jgi:acyl carrier protein
VLIELDEVCRTVGLVMGQRDIQAGQRLMEDLGCESIDVLNIMVTLEEKFGVSIDEATMAGVTTVRSLFDIVSKSPHAAMSPENPSRPA